MKKLISLILAALLALSTLTAGFAATYTDKDTVKKVQQALNDAGYECGTPDGIAGKKTAAAITQYQTEKGLEATGTIDDALLEAMGLAKAEETGAEAEVEAKVEAETEAGAETGAEAKTGQSDVTAEQLAEAFGEAPDEELDLTNLEVMVEVYNILFSARLMEFGVDFQSENIGQAEYLIYKVDPDYGTMDARRIYLQMHDSELLFSFIESSRPGEIGFLDHAAIYAYFLVTSILFDCSKEETAGLLALLGEAPPRDGTISVEDIDFRYLSDSVEVEGWKNRPLDLTAKKAGIH